MNFTESQIALAYDIVVAIVEALEAELLSAWLDPSLDVDVVVVGDDVLLEMRGLGHDRLQLGFDGTIVGLLETAIRMGELVADNLE